MPAAKKKAATKKASSNDIVIDMTITTPDGTKHQDTVTIANASGCITRSRVNNADTLVAQIADGLRAKFGRGHIKV